MLCMFPMFLNRSRACLPLGEKNEKLWSTKWRSFLCNMHVRFCGVLSAVEAIRAETAAAAAAGAGAGGGEGGVGDEVGVQLLVDLL